jgi:uncharacterized protein YegP (UPF0339 family)
MPATEEPQPDPERPSQPITHRFEPYRSEEDGQYRWRLVHSNGRVLAMSSESYVRAVDRDTALLNTIDAIVKGNYEVTYGDD